MQPKIDYMKTLDRGLDAIEPERSALVILDAVNAFATPTGAAVQSAVARFVPDASRDQAFRRVSEEFPVAIEKIAESVKRVRDLGGLVVWSNLDVDGCSPDQAPRSTAFLLDAIAQTKDPSQSDLVPPLVRDATDVQVVRPGLSSFAHTRLEMVLRQRGIESVMVAGFLTDGAVASTSRDASDFGYQSILVSDACGGIDPERAEAAVNSHARLFGHCVASASLFT